MFKIRNYNKIIKIKLANKIPIIYNEIKAMLQFKVLKRTMKKPSSGGGAQLKKGIRQLSGDWPPCTITAWVSPKIAKNRLQIDPKPLQIVLKRTIWL